MEFNDVVLESRLRAHLGDDPALTQALALARAAHARQFRAEGTPYICHPLRVALILVEEAGIVDTGQVAAALLHDVLEDDPSRSAAEIEAAIGGRVAGLVECLTDEFRQLDMPRDQRKALYLARFARASDECLVVKLCDRLDNLRSLAHVSDAVKKERMRRETRTWLLPAVDGRGEPFPRLAELLEQALSE